MKKNISLIVIIFITFANLYASDEGWWGSPQLYYSIEYLGELSDTEYGEAFDTIEKIMNEEFSKIREIKKLSKNQLNVLEHAIDQYDVKVNECYGIRLSVSPDTLEGSFLFVRIVSSNKYNWIGFDCHN